MASPAILSNFFEKQWTKNHPQYLSGLSRALYPTTILEIAVYGKKLVSGRRIALPAESTWAKLTPLPYNQANSAARAGAGSADRVDQAMPARSVYYREKLARLGWVTLSSQ